MGFELREGEKDHQPKGVAEFDYPENCNGCGESYPYEALSFRRKLCPDCRYESQERSKEQQRQYECRRRGVPVKPRKSTIIDDGSFFTPAKKK